jgi:hypothetical protein
LDLRGGGTPAGWRRLYNEELHNLYASSNFIRVIKSRRIIWAGNVARIRDMRNAYNILVGNPEDKRSFGSSRHRWKDNIRMDLSEIGWRCVDWMHLAQEWDQ